MNEAIIGIDPGINGAISAIKGNKIILLEVCPKIKTGNRHEYDVTEMAKLIKSMLRYNPKVYLEKVHAMPKQGVTSMFNFGKGYGVWIGICAALKIPFHLIMPNHWKKKMLYGTDKSKGASIMMVKQLFPDVDLRPGRCLKDHDGLAESILIGVYGGMQEWK